MNSAALSQRALPPTQPQPPVDTQRSALGDQGAQTMPVLLSALDDNETRYWALLAISDLGSEAKDAVPRLNRLLGTANTLDRRDALMALGNTTRSDRRD